MSLHNNSTRRNYFHRAFATATFSRSRVRACNMPGVELLMIDLLSRALCRENEISGCDRCDRVPSFFLFFLRLLRKSLRRLVKRTSHENTSRPFATAFRDVTSPFIETFLHTFLFTSGTDNRAIKGNIIKSSFLQPGREVKQKEKNAARSRCLLFRYTGSYSRFISGSMDGGFRLLQLSHSLTQYLLYPLVFPASREHLRAFLWFISIHRRGRKSMELVTNLLHCGKAGD